MQSPSENEVARDIDAYGDRPSSRLLAGDFFQTFKTQNILGQIRFIETGRSWVAANEPLSPPSSKVELFDDFSRQAKQNKKTAVLAPVSEPLALSLKEKGFFIEQIGQEALFELAEYFDFGKDPLSRFSHAKAIRNKGAVVREITVISEESKKQITDLVTDWHRTKGVSGFGFLNRMNPFEFTEHKKIFVLEYQDRIQAFLTVLPFNSNKCAFFSEYARHSLSRVGSMELLFVETMRQLKSEGYQTVSLGLSPLVGSSNGVLKWVYEKVSTPYSFKSVFEFKNKFRPSHWENLYLVSNVRPGFKLINEFLKLTYPDGIWVLLFKNFKRFVKPEFQLEQPLLPLHTLALNFTFVLLHYLRAFVPSLENLYGHSAYQPAHVSALGLFAGPFFHNTSLHLWGDVLSFVLFGALVEMYVGRKAFWTLVCAGLWLSNPLTHLILATLLPFYSAKAYAHFLTEQDYGSSNALYAIIGGLGFYLARPKNLIIPFVFFATYINFAKSSWIALHHLIALGAGYALTKFLTRSEKEMIP